ncbi:GntR family transcriptional regulator [Saccharibacillus kuerlensis]|uniref:HTH gntR-type domain-containing protein n=1 Tax=Saccharibacillus kuerlensis TaxID=459527 RepID=A0ABQ2LCN2_9BACL|nr:GntR family transcriptional regulator [Saccharibacillus kuerlensis]GGO09430.1 hypothetical protein GCM10010969_39850 [Saccharibacillus kuerlensis]
MDKKQLGLRIDSDWTFNVNTQIREQLRCKMAAGELQLGDMLPSASQLADELGVNRNTINLVYNQLRDEGFVTMNKGRGTQITQKAAQLRKESAAQLKLIEETVQRAKNEGHDLQSFFTMGFSYMMMQQESSSAFTANILLIECKGHDHFFYSRAIEQAAGGNVKTVFLEDLPEASGIRDILQGIDVVVTTLNHASEVRRKFSAFDCRIVVIGADAKPSILVELAGLERGTHVAFACLGKTGGEWMAERVKEAGIHHLSMETIGWKEEDHSQTSLDQVDRIYASDAVFQELYKLAPDKVTMYPMKLEQSSENLLQNMIL